MEIRDRIIDGAAELFRTYGIRAVTMDSLAGHLGMSKRTIYENFSDKDELLVGVLRNMAEKQRELVLRVLEESDNSVVAIFRLLEINMVHFQDMSPAFQADLKKYHKDVLMDRSEKCEMPDYKVNMLLIERGIKEKLFRRNISPDLVNRGLYLMIRSMIDQDLFPYDQFTRKDIVKNLFINYLRGIATDEGMELINKLDSKF
ncbi:MAG: TetR/AcrR family transcriptional regulator [Bacteroidales bacterium]|jgi:AcrR family transcriptional regulator|nr:TetR/AcrR family transcriptional regulator [Bacteroidales bacterium]MCU0408057.1 TetR/AcrR family transcriptional regulator [Bacteroidales bacterium]